jgi:hypothetical protein
MKRGTLISEIIALALLGPSVALAGSDQTTNPGLFFTIQNACNSSVNGFAVGDEICLLQVGMATYTRAVFDGDMAPGATQFAMACTGSDGKGEVIFVPPVSTAIDAVKVSVSPNETVSIPSTFCGVSHDARIKQYGIKKK